MTETGKPGAVGRRQFLKAAVATGAAGSGLLAAPRAPRAATAVTGPLARAADLAAAAGPRMLVIGGGWSGLTLAKYLKKANPAFDVVLVEPNATFFSCPLSNLWLGGLLQAEVLLHSYVDAARNNDYVWLQATLVDLDRQQRRAFTSSGYIDYDYIVLAPGIDYNYASIGVADPGAARRLAQTFPAAFKTGSEHISLKARLNRFTGGTFVLTVPQGHFRCSAGPYERACLMAAWFKKNHVKGKIVLIDHAEQPVINAPGFLAAFEELYSDVIDYQTSATIEGVDVDRKIITTDFDEIAFDDAAIYPRVRAARLLEDLGLADMNSAQFEPLLDPLKYHVPGDERTYVAGDARPMPFSKSGNTASTEARFLARSIAGHAAGKQVPWQSPNTVCYSLVNADPAESIMIDSKYRHDGTGHGWGFTGVKVINKRTSALGREKLKWGRRLFADMFS